MCFELDSLPPVPRIASAAVSHDDIELEAADGNRFAAFEATPDEPNGIGVVILPDVRGLYGRPGERDGVPGPTERAAEIEAPSLAFQAGDDQHITSEMNEGFERALTDAGVE